MAGLYISRKGKPNKKTKINGYDWELLCEAPFFIQKSQKGTENYDESNGKKTGSTKNQEKTLKRMMAYQKKAEQMVSRKE